LFSFFCHLFLFAEYLLSIQKFNTFCSCFFYQEVYAPFIPVLLLAMKSMTSLCIYPKDVQKTWMRQGPVPGIPGVDFINFLRKAFTYVDPKSAKKAVKYQPFWAFGIYKRKSCAYTCWWNQAQISEPMLSIKFIIYIKSYTAKKSGPIRQFILKMKSQ